MFNASRKLLHAIRQRCEMSMSYDNYVSYRNASILVEVDTPTYDTEIERQFYERHAQKFNKERFELSQGIVYW